MKPARNRNERRGVVLLLVLGIMAMFGMVALAYVLITGHSKREAKSYQRAAEYPITPHEEAHEAALQVFRGSRSPASPVRQHGLLEDMYGHTHAYADVVHGVPLDNAPPYCVNPNYPNSRVVALCSGQLIGITPTLQTKTYPAGTTVYRSRYCPEDWATYSQPDDIAREVIAPIKRGGMGCAGRVLTMQGGPFRGKSTRIVGYDSQNDLLMILPFEGVPTATFVGYYQGNPGAVHSYIINGMPFSGTGFGYSTAATPPLADDLGNYLPATMPPDPLLVQPGGGSFPSLREALVSLPYALLPNRTGDPSNSDTHDLRGPGLANEDYDAPDYQNMALAGMLPDGNVPIPSFHRPALINYWFHRVVDEWLVNVIGLEPVDAWRVMLQPDRAIAAGVISDPAIRDAVIALKRRMFFRPLDDLHGNFSGSNAMWQAWKAQDVFDTSKYPTIAEVYNEYWLGLVPPARQAAGFVGGMALNGPWDVDNNGDGKPDGIWMDLGFPVRTASDGRRYKPLFSILCVDLDGRLNLNAAGALAQTLAAYSADADTSGSALVFANQAQTAGLGRGQGYGPPEISLLPVLENDAMQYRALLMGKDIDPVPARIRWLEGRYGEAGGPYVTDTNADGIPDDPRYVAPGRSFRPLGSFDRSDANMIRSDDPLSRNKLFQLAGVESYLDPLTAFGTPPDLKGSMAVGLDLRGQPLYLPLVDRAVNSLDGGSNDRFAWPGVNDPYELDLSRKAPRSPRITRWEDPNSHPSSQIDNPFTVHELERLLRRNDVDAATLPDRLEKLAPNLVGHRHSVTVESWHVPSPAVGYLRQSSGAATRIPHFTSLLSSRFTGDLRDRPEWWPAHVPPEMLAGLKMNLKRPFGNGRDDNGNGVVDEVEEVCDWSAPEDTTAWEPLYLVDAAGNPVTVPMDHCGGVDVDGNGNDVNNNGVVDPEDRALIALDRGQARQLFARYLYILAILVADNNIYPLGSSNWDARALAQWAVNVVDFCDRDSIMTRFPYDRNPLNGWDPTDTTDNPDFPNNVVWGCERPELLISETVAFHDRRSQDLDAGGGSYWPDQDDDDFDQRIYPEGSLFFELYNPWTVQEHSPAELTGGAAGVMLNRTHDGTAAGDPVWRVLIATPLVDPNDPAADLDDPSVSGTDLQDRVERSVYFVEPVGDYQEGAEVRYYPKDPSVMAPIMPGRYALIGPGERPAGNPNGPLNGTTYLGFRSGMTEGDNQTRRFVLAPNVDPTVQQAEVFSHEPSPGGGFTVDAVAGADCQAPVAVAIDWSDAPDAIGNGGAETRKHPRLSLTEPFDGYPLYNPGDLGATEYVSIHDQPLDQGGDFWTGGVEVDGTTARFRVVHLQRLANPLAPFHAQNNPYLTIDRMQVDLTAFNGVTNDPDPLVVAGTYSFFPRERGTENDPTNPNNLWAMEPEVDTAPPTTPVRAGNSAGQPTPGAGHFFDEVFGHSLGWLNAHFGDTWDAAAGPYEGDPRVPFPWLTWINRPFVNELELLLVPDERSSQLLAKYTIGQEANDPYQPGDDTQLSFAHLLPFLGTPPDTGGTPLQRASRLYRLLDFVHVPSRFVGTELQANPTTTANWWPDMSLGINDNVPILWPPFSFPFRPPYNGISNYREPGRVNVNTISAVAGTTPAVWQGLLGGFPALAGTSTDYWQEMAESRRGYTPTPGMGNLNENFPTQVANPFRSPAGRHLVPLQNLHDDIGDQVHATLLREDPTNTGRPLFRHERPSNVPTDPANTSRNPYFRYQLHQRLAGTATTRSNVYAVWVTVGYFEVLPAVRPPTWPLSVYQGVFPAGDQLGPELGSDTGDVKRHRAFYIFDRSIPVGFERGRNNNVEEAILLERFIE